MIQLTATEFSRKFKVILDLVEYHGEEVILTRNNHKVARITPGSPHLTAIEAMSDLYRTLPESAAGDWERDSRITGTLGEMKDPWE
jgi:antitoxin (DNA-binding transcriptional repressor) of toxin-antitoxin stability system